MKWLLHFGAHKTASTSLQLFLTKNRKPLGRHGIEYVAGEEWAKSKAYAAFKRIRGRDGLHPDHVAQIAEFFNGHAETANRRLSVFSNEGIYGQHNLATMGGLYPTHDLINRVFAEALRGKDYAVVLYVRRQDTFLESTYLQTVHYGSYMHFYDYISAVDLSLLKWSPMVRSMHAHFGKERVFVYPFEHIRTGFRHYLELMLRPVLGDDLERILKDLSFEGLGSRNRSFSELALQIARVAYPLIESSDDRRALRTFLQNSFSNETHGRAKLIAPPFRKFLLDQYREDNKLLMQLCGETDARILDHYVSDDGVEQGRSLNPAV